MKNKILFFTSFLIIFDVIGFPSSCVENSGGNKSNLCIFDYSVIDDGIFYSSNARMIYDLPNDGIVKMNFNAPNVYENYVLTYWYLYLDEEKTPITFPYTYLEEDLVSYYQGFRNSLVFIANWQMQPIAEENEESSN